MKVEETRLICRPKHNNNILVLGLFLIKPVQKHLIQYKLGLLRQCSGIILLELLEEYLRFVCMSSEIVKLTCDYMLTKSVQN